ncbi:hypothetical protein LPJ74_004641 [Coemansia sp. RSA 1843]|nr:hypothetical protein LPJ74_004641 [Coemansia sp. RSA 1843]
MFGGSSWPVEPENTPKIQLLDAQTIVPAQQTQEYMATIITPKGHMKCILCTCPVCTPPVIPLLISSTVFADEELTNPAQAPTGKCRIRAAFLRPLGDEKSADDFHIWDSQEFTIA